MIQINQGFNPGRGSTKLKVESKEIGEFKEQNRGLIVEIENFKNFV